MSLVRVEAGPISAFWLSCMALCLALAYVLPNHYLPWTSFHAEVWAAAVITFLGAWICWRSRMYARTYMTNLLVALAMVVSLGQFAFGQVSLWGICWINIGYLLGLQLAMLTGEIWERQSPGQCMNYLSIALIAGSLLSLPVEFFQWLNVQWITPLLMHTPDVYRPFANMAQPNLLADLYLLSLVGVSWQHANQRICGWVAISLAVLLLTGIALTGSRAAGVNVLVLLGFSTILKPKAGMAARTKIAVVLAIYFFAVSLTASTIQAALLRTDVAGELRQLSTSSVYSRIAVWRMMSAAGLLEPWWGYGWGQVIKTNFVFEDGMGVERGLFNQSHNFFLDLMLWNGYPLGLLLACGAVWWIWRLMRLDRSLANWHVQAFAAILCVHSLVEFPLYYTYFLFPMGLLLGTVQSSIFEKPVVEIHRGLTLSLMLMGMLMVVVTVRDYFIVEQSFYELRFETRGIASDAPRSPPDTWALTQLREHLRYSRTEPDPQVTTAQLQQMEEVVRVTPGPHIMYRLAWSYALSGNSAKAAYWLKQICEKTIEVHCDDARKKWEAARSNLPERSDLQWPLQVQ